MDNSNPVVKLCSEGMQAEAEGRFDDARSLFLRAWEARTDDFDACIAAHFVARHQESPEETLRWNREALNRADAVGDERVRDFYPSLYLNLGWSYEAFGDPVKASKYYEMAAERLGKLPEGRYKEVVRGGIAAGRERLQSTESGQV